MLLRRLVCAIGLLLWTVNLGAQVPTATVSGRVVSADGLSLPGVTVTVTSANLLGERVLVTSENGDYIVPLLPPGDYTITFELAGFQSLSKSVALAGTQSVPLNITMSVAGLNESVQVTGSSTPFVETATVATKFRQDLMTTLPSNRTLDSRHCSS